MTRINCIPVSELNNKMLFAEYRELPRVFSWLEAALERGKPLKIPEKYCLGKGHVTFFGNKLKYLNNRHGELVEECRKRKFKITLMEKLCWVHIGIPLEYWNDWTHDKAARELNRQRINERLKSMADKKDSKNKMTSRDIDWEAYEGDTILVYIDSTSTYKELVLYKYDPMLDTPFICLLPGSTRLYLGRHAQLPKDAREFLMECD